MYVLLLESDFNRSSEHVDADQATYLNCSSNAAWIFLLKSFMRLYVLLLTFPLTPLTSKMSRILVL